MERTQTMTPSKRKRLLKTFGSCPAGYTHDDLERLLDVLYGMFSDVYTSTELRQIVVSNPFDRSDHPCQLKLVELTDWLEAIVARPPPGISLLQPLLRSRSPGAVKAISPG